LNPSKKEKINETAMSEMLAAYECLPNNWRVIYHEAFRGNHLLFDAADVESFNGARKLSLSASTGDKKVALRAAVRIVGEQSITNMRNQVNQLGIESKYYLFRLYLRYVDSMRDQVKNSHN
jgi:hypothetical protein